MSRIGIEPIWNITAIGMNCIVAMKDDPVAGLNRILYSVPTRGNLRLHERFVLGEPHIVIEGHTDSTGSDAMNEHLSQRRADSVREYFVANGTLPKDKIVSVGYGSKRPLASNQTAEGRAINRRIDLIITPPPQSGLTLSSRG